MSMQFHRQPDLIAQLHEAIEPHTYVPALARLRDTCIGATDAQAVVRPLRDALAARCADGDFAVLGRLRDRLLEMAAEIESAQRGRIAA